VSAIGVVLARSALSFVGDVEGGTGAPAWYRASVGAMPIEPLELVRTKNRPRVPEWYEGRAGQMLEREFEEGRRVDEPASQLEPQELRTNCAAAPTAGAIASPYGRRRSIQDPSTQRQHQGVDLAGATGAPVYAVADGIVEHATQNGARGFGCYGRALVIRHPQFNDERSFYAHLSGLSVAVGDVVRAGQRVAALGSTNGSTAHPDTTFGDGACLPGGQFRPGAGGSGPHLHFEVARRAYPMAYEVERLDPIVWLAAHGIGYSENARGGRPLAMMRCGDELVAQNPDLETMPAMPIDSRAQPSSGASSAADDSAGMAAIAMVAIVAVGAAVAARGRRA
jgi:murein DD-endopeptidase MepM/ murein hydrolase activator NlpD